jgi:hypothetical protein
MFARCNFWARSEVSDGEMAIGGVKESRSVTMVVVRVQNPDGMQRA